MNEEVSTKLTIAMVDDGVTDCIAGSFISTRRFSEGLSARGHTVLYVTARSRRHPTHDVHNGIRAYRFRSVLMPKSEGQLYLGFPTAGELEKVFTDERVGVVHTTATTPMAWAATKAAKKLGIPLVMHSHMQPENIFLHLPRFLPLARLNRAFYRYLHARYRKADAVVFPSAFAKGLLPALHSMRHEVISNGVNTDIFRPRDPAPFFEKFGLDPANKHVLYLGRLHPEKSVDTLIRAVPRILKGAPGTHILIAGFGHLDTKLKRLAEELGVAEHVTFCGRLADEELALAYSAADIYVLPSLAELEGMTVLEAMACGAPILIADAKDSAATHFVDGNGSLFAPEDSADLAEKALALLTDDDLRERSAAASLELSRRYDIATSITRLEELYRTLINTV
ncbi:MAG: glycosyltransferase [bacterium]|nr:glycosyltransferase [bacterium]